MSTSQKHDHYQDSGVEWLGEIPAHWPVERNLGVFDERNERGRPDDELLSVTINRGVIRQSEITTKKDSSNEDKSKYKVLKAGDLAYNKMRAWQGALGISPYDGIVSPAYIILKPKNLRLSKYFHYLYRTPQFIEEANRLSYGLCDDMNSLRYEHFKGSYSPLPPDGEVDRIVAFLDEKTAQIDALIAKKERQLQLLDEQKSIRINQAVTRGLNPDVKFKPSGIEWIGEIPEHWEVKKLRWLLRTSVKNGISPTITENGEVPTLSIAAVRNGDVTFGENVKYTTINKSDAASYLLKTGDILALRGNGSKHLVATAGIVGEDVPQGCIYPDLLIRIQPTTQIASRYLVLQLNQVMRERVELAAKTSAGIWKVSGESLSALKALLPPPDDQRSILEYVDDIQKKTNESQLKILNLIVSLKTLRSTLIAHAVTGKIRV
ncbi:MAG: hypothetical protein GVY36_09340 [Verrucomicrobia bacterium]|nr:hypothetical protein [Verrucomicrobiota bacterium]